ncbi:protein IWS1 homolog isoform X4 [Dunckerocampus dactyliophorus]|uniref:protein IWS1 homolog isoform X4 n=1 Tax=Dunckerocampus dactyliophorus TaxID=161453 RepID=UPI0024070C60|nr:protein IWS1 homolog isoform X4 [Dunckerocampus dactyliophorus]
MYRHRPKTGPAEMDLAPTSCSPSYANDCRSADFTSPGLDIQQLTGRQGDRRPQPQGGSSTWEQEETHPIKEEEEPQPPLIKEEEMEPHIKEEEGEKPHPPLIKEEETELEHPHIKEEEAEKPQPPLIKEEEMEPEHPHIKEEEEEPQPPDVKEEEGELSITQEGEHLPGPEEADLARLPLTGDHEDKPPELSQLHHSPSEEMSEAEPSCSSSLQHMTTEADGDHCGGSQADNLLAPLSDSDDTTSHSPEGEDSEYNRESLSSDTDSEGDMMTGTGNKHSKSSKKTTGKRSTWRTHRENTQTPHRDAKGQPSHHQALPKVAPPPSATYLATGLFRMSEKAFGLAAERAEVKVAMFQDKSRRMKL